MNKYIKKKHILHHIVSIFINIICVIVVCVSIIICYACINAKIQRTCPSFAGYSNMIIASKSMTNSGFNVGETIIVRSVDTDTLNVGDAIAFYVYKESFSSFDIENCSCDNEIKTTKYTPISLKSLLGFQNDSIKTASQSGSNIVFHHIAEIYKDNNGKRWFITKGSSNSVNDSWYISEDYVIGLYTNSDISKIISYVLTNIFTGKGIFILLIPVIVCAIIIIISILKSIKNYKTK